MLLLTHCLLYSVLFGCSYSDCTAGEDEQTFLTPKDDSPGAVCDNAVRRLILNEATDVTTSLPQDACQGPPLIPKSWDTVTSDLYSCEAPPTPPACSDSPLRLKIPKDGSIITRSCEWVARVDTATRCNLPGVSAACPVTCGSCDTCADPELRFKFTYNNNNIARSCEFVGRVESKIGGRCAASQNICRLTCGTC